MEIEEGILGEEEKNISDGSLFNEILTCLTIYVVGSTAIENCLRWSSVACGSLALGIMYIIEIAGIFGFSISLMLISWRIFIFMTKDLL